MKATADTVRIGSRVLLGIERQSDMSIVVLLSLIAGTAGHDGLVFAAGASANYRPESRLKIAAEQVVLYSVLICDFSPRKRVRVEFVVLTECKEISIERHSLSVTLVQVRRTKQIVVRDWWSISAGFFRLAPSTI